MIIGAILIALLVAWLLTNLVKTPDAFVTNLIIGITNGAVYGLIAIGYSLVYGILELINFAHGDIFMLGGMMTSTLVSSLGLAAGDAWYVLFGGILLMLLVAMAFCAALNAGTERIAYRRLRYAPRIAPLITAIGMSFIFQTVGLVWLVRYTRQGKAMRATAQDKDAAAMMGIDVNRTISFTFLVAGGLAGAAGVVFAFYSTTIAFNTGFTVGLFAFTAAVLGGIGNLPGAVLGAILIGLIQNFNEGLPWHSPGSEWTESIVFAVLILILVFRPQGLLGERTPEGG